MGMDAVYRDHADTYARLSAENPVQACYDRPTILRLAGDLRGRRVLELGCAAGYLTELLAARGADVLALDREPSLVRHARARLGDRARVEVADLEEPLVMVPTNGVDLVVASLVLHYVEDWQPLLSELHRCLKPAGELVFSVHHPITGWNRSDRTDYHRTELIREEWEWEGQRVVAEMFRRPISDIFGSLREAGFLVDVVDEPLPEELPTWTEPAMQTALTTTPVFLFVRAVRAAPPGPVM